MKKITIIILTCLISATAFQSCVIEESDYRSTSDKPFNIFSYWRYGFSEAQMCFPNVAFNFNTWLEASEVDRDSISKLYFPKYVIRGNEDGSWSLLRNGVEAYNIVTNGQSLSDVGASWILRAYYSEEEELTVNSSLGYTFNDNVSFNNPVETAAVTCSAPGKWVVDVNKPEDLVLGEYPNFLLVTISTPNLVSISDLRDGGYYIEGCGQFEFLKRYCYDENDPEFQTVKLYFQTEEPLYCDGKYVWNAGTVNISANNGEVDTLNRTEEVKAEFLPIDATRGHTVRLIFHGNEHIMAYGH